MDLILLSCSGSKIFGGEIGVFKSFEISNYLDQNGYSKLINLRKIIAKQIGEANGEDIGYKEGDEKIELMPAYQRYSGKIFEVSNFSTIYRKTNNLKVILISAFYGILDASDPIRHYSWKMDNMLPMGIKTLTWWKNNGLGDLLLEIINNLNPKEIYNFLFDKYKAAIHTFIRKYPSDNIKTINTLPGYDSMKITGEKLSEIMKQYL